jgi:hypothetical protein
MPRLIVNGQELDLDLSKLLNVEVIALTKAIGVKFSEIGQKLADYDFETITALVWILRKRTEPTLRFDEVEFEIGSMRVEDDPKVDPTDEPSTTSDTDPSSPITSDSTPGTSTS